MKIIQLIAKGLWNKDHVLIQIPRSNKELINRYASRKGSSDTFKDEPIESIDDVLTLGDDAPNAKLNLPDKK